MKIIEETTEFGLDMVRGLPITYYCVQNDIPHKCIVKPALENLYKLITPSVEVTKHFHPINPASLYSFTRPSWTEKNWTPPPLKKIFNKKNNNNIHYDIPEFSKPVIVINNKFSACWDENNVRHWQKEFNMTNDMEEIMLLPTDTKVHPTATKWGQRTTYNGIREVSLFHYSIPMLNELINLLSEKYQIVYIRPIEDSHEYFTDHNITWDPGDYDFLEKNHPGVYTIKEFLNKNDHMNFTFAQFALEALSDKHLSTLGGNCKVSAYFGGDVLIYKGSRIWHHGHPKGARQLFDTGSWLKHLSDANIVSLITYDDILDYVTNKWL